MTTAAPGPQNEAATPHPVVTAAPGSRDEAATSHPVITAPSGPRDEVATPHPVVTATPGPRDEAAALLQALQVKVAAFSDSAWLAHWDLTAPSLLAHGWASVYPHVPLPVVERATGVRFLVAAVSGESGEDGEEVMSDLVKATESLDITADASEMETANQNITQIPSTPATDEEIKRFWGDLYNSYYWYCYQNWVEGEGEGEGEGEVIVITPELVSC